MFESWTHLQEVRSVPESRKRRFCRQSRLFHDFVASDPFSQNYRRVAEVWMDEYAQYLYKRRPHYKDLDPGDLTKQKALREKLQCKPFKWFMENVAFDIVNKYPLVEPPDFGVGEVRRNPQYCGPTLTSTA